MPHGKPDTPRAGLATQEARLERALALLNEAQELANVGSAVFDLETKELEWSPHVYRICGLDPETFVPSLENAMAMVHPDDVAAMSAAVGKTFEGESFDLEFRLLTGDGRTRRVHVRTRVGRGPDGAPRTVRGTMMDVTERRALEERARRSERLEALGTLSGGIAHNLNNYLQILAGSVDQLQGADDAEEAEEARANVSRALRLCASLSAGLLDLSQERPFLPEVTDVHALIRQSFDLVAFVLAPQMEVHLDLAAEQRQVRCDPRQLGQVFVNLALNARDAIERAGSIRVVTRSAADDELVVEFTDTGHGIAPEDIEHVFDPFFTTKSPGRGTGLGLSISYASVQASGGSMTLTSRVGEGTTITIRLPLASV